MLDRSVGKLSEDLFKSKALQIVRVTVTICFIRTLLTRII